MTTCKEHSNKWATRKDEVRSCPFCGLQPELMFDGSFWTLWCIRTECSVSVEVSSQTREMVILYWNQRDPP